MFERPLGNRRSKTFEHIDKYPLRLATIPEVNKTLYLPYSYRIYYDQGAEGACAGFSGSWLSSINNHTFFDAFWLYHEAQAIDEWDDTPPEEGTSVRAVMDVLRDVGHRRIYRGKSLTADLKYGIIENRWATTVDEIRSCVSMGLPVSIGVNWYRNFDDPQKVGTEYWIGRGNLGYIRGGHAVCIYAASDKKQAVKIVNNWGVEYPLVWMPYETLQRLLNEYGEATMITDRV